MKGIARCLAVWGAATGAALLLVAWLLPGSVGGEAADPGGFDRWLVSGCGLAAAGCVTWLWVLVTLVVLDSLRGRPARTAVPAVVRRLVLAACGLSLAGGWVVPAHADHRPAPPPQSAGTVQTLLVGLPLPDRTTTTTEWIGSMGELGRHRRPAPESAAAASAPPAGSVVVEPGDTLWDIARDTLPPDAGPEEIDRRWRAIYRANREAVGADPDLIRPGQRLLVPPLGERPR